MKTTSGLCLPLLLAASAAVVAVAAGSLGSSSHAASGLRPAAQESSSTPTRTLRVADSRPFVFHWEAHPRPEPQRRSHVIEPPVVHVLDERSEPPAAGDRARLLGDYGVELLDREQPWTGDHAQRLLETLETLQQGAPSKWVLTGASLVDDVEVETLAAGRVVHLSSAVFEHAGQRSAVVDDERGSLYSKRLQHAVVRVVTDGGRDLDVVERILNERFGVSTRVPDYRALTAATTAETAARFQPFHPAELMFLIEQFEEMPEDMHVTEGLRFLVRRLDGTPHPLQDAPATAWTRAGYIEFMETAFRQDSVDFVQRLILHEKAHFSWAFELTEALRTEWTELGGWYPSTRNSNGWATSRQTEFVSSYAHAKNPDEDFAESVSFYVMNPDKLRSRAPRKLEFLREEIMPTTRYLAQIRGDLTLQVEDLDPDYDLPGMIERVDIAVDGEPEADKTVTIEIELNALDGARSGASQAAMRITSEVGTYVDVLLRPRDASGSVLGGSFRLSRFAKSGHWKTDQVVLTDPVGNQRFGGGEQFGWRLFVDNPLEDLDKPRYVPGTISLVAFARPDAQVLRAEWSVEESVGMAAHAPCSAKLVPEGQDVHSLFAYGRYDPATRKCSVEWEITRHHPSGAYALRSLSMRDMAGNYGSTTFTEQAGENPTPIVRVRTSDPDGNAPELDLDAILVTAEPTRPQAPNGETKVKIVYRVRDDRSGLGPVSYKLRDPQGIDHFAYDYHPDFHTRTFQGDPTAWKAYEIDVVLPVGSAPGTWGLSSMSTTDKVGNTQLHDFVEILHFDVEPPARLL